MGWIKRNLFFVVGGLIALMLLGAAAFYDYRSWDHNATTFERLNEIYSKLKELNDKKPSPGNTKVDNIKSAKEQEQEVRDWINGTVKTFRPIEPIPNLPEVTSEAFAGELRRMIDVLQHEADQSSVQLPPKYGFSFEAQRLIVRFAPGSLNPLAMQLGEVRAISEILFAARVNSLDGIQRVRVSEDDLTGPQADYISETATTNNLAIMTPYVVTFRSFTPELASVLAGFASSPNGLIVKSLNVMPAAASSQAAGPMFQGYDNGNGQRLPPLMPTPSASTGHSGGLPTVLKEQLLRITLEVVIVQPLPKK